MRGVRKSSAKVSPRLEIQRCTCHAKVRPCAPSAAPATHKQPGPNSAQARATNRQRIKVLHLTRKSSSSSATCCTCHAKVGPCAPSAAHATLKLPGLSGTQARTANRQIVKVLHLPRRSSSSTTKCCTCNAKVRPCAPSAAPATHKQPGPNGA